MFSCKCLNVLIHTKSNDIQKVELESLHLSDAEKIDHFFSKEFGSVVVETITKQQSGLVINRSVGLWFVHHCMNCSLDIYAVHRDRGASCVLVANDLLSGPSNISILRSSDNYSKSFGILINPWLREGQIESKTAASQLPDNLQLVINGLQRELGDILKREVTATEERVRRFTEMQYTALETFREQVHKEHNALVRLILNNHPDINIKKQQDKLCPAPFLSSYQTDNDFQLRTSSENETQAISPKTVVSKPKHPIVTNLTSKVRRIPSRQFSHPVAKMDSDDILFPIDGMEESPGLSHSDVEESDTDDSTSHDEGIHIPRQRIPSVSIAKSLPMNIPVFITAYAHDASDDRENLKTKEDSVDIAASIKALAKSVHGDDVFGDLPRPRFSTQI